MDSPHTLLVEGWRFLPHSYSVVNQFQCLEFLRRPNLNLFHRDVPYIFPDWRPMSGLFPPDAERALRNIHIPTRSDIPDAVFRIAWPYDLSRSNAKRTVVFGTSEYQKVTPNFIKGGQPLAIALKESDAIIVTPSNWSKNGFLYDGADPSRLFVVPHGVDTSIFHPIDPSQRNELRQKHKWSGFVFLNIGTLTPNKGIPELLKAFAVVAEKHPHVRLALKGLDSLYRSAKFLKAHAGILSSAQAQLMERRLMYYRDSLTFAELARFYQMADAYVSPYIAEAFNMPVLESIACGLPVICTAGGPTDDFTTPDFALPINSRLITHPPQSTGRFALGIDFDHLVHQMITAVESPNLATRAAATGPAFISNGYTWQQVTDRLLAILFPQAAPSDAVT